MILGKRGVLVMILAWAGLVLLCVAAGALAYWAADAIGPA